MGARKSKNQPDVDKMLCEMMSLRGEYIKDRQVRLECIPNRAPKLRLELFPNETEKISNWDIENANRNA